VGEPDLSGLITLAMLCNAMRHLGADPPPQMRNALAALQAREQGSATRPIERRAMAKIADARRVWAA